MYLKDIAQFVEQHYEAYFDHNPHADPSEPDLYDQIIPGLVSALRMHLSTGPEVLPAQPDIALVDTKQANDSGDAAIHIKMAERLLENLIEARRTTT